MFISILNEFGAKEWWARWSRSAFRDSKRNESEGSIPRPRKRTSFPPSTRWTACPRWAQHLQASVLPGGRRDRFPAPCRASGARTWSWSIRRSGCGSAVDLRVLEALASAVVAGLVSDRVEAGEWRLSGGRHSEGSFSRGRRARGTGSPENSDLIKNSKCQLIRSEFIPSVTVLSTKLKNTAFGTFGYSRKTKHPSTCAQATRTFGLARAANPIFDKNGW